MKTTRTENKPHPADVMAGLPHPQNPPGKIGHNTAGVSIVLEARLFNSLARFAQGNKTKNGKITLPAGSTVGDMARHLGIPFAEIFLVLVNGRDITPGPGMIGQKAAIREGYTLEDGDVVAFSGPVPYSWGYGAPVV